MYATCPAHRNLIFVNIVTVIGEMYISRSFSLLNDLMTYQFLSLRILRKKKQWFCFSKLYKI